MAEAGREDDATLPDSKSPGNAGARGSRGAANSGAQAGNSTEGDGRAVPDDGPKGPDLRDARAQGGGGVSSESSRSKNDPGSER